MTRGEKRPAHAWEAAYVGRSQRCATPRCRNLAVVCCNGYCWTCSSRRNSKGGDVK